MAHDRDCWNVGCVTRLRQRHGARSPSARLTAPWSMPRKSSMQPNPSYSVASTPASASLTIIERVGPNTLTVNDVAATWPSVLNHEVNWGGDDLAAFERQAAKMM